MQISNNLPKLSNDRFILTAPGLDIVSTVPTDRYYSMAGTSMATPQPPPIGYFLSLGASYGASAKQVIGAMSHGGINDLLMGKPNFLSEEEYLQLDAQDMLKEASAKGISVQKLLQTSFCVQDEMPLIFDNDAERDKYFQDRIDRRAEMVEAIKAVENAPGYNGPKTDWSGEKAVQLSQLDPTEKAAFYSQLDSLNQAYYGKVITMLT